MTSQLPVLTTVELRAKKEAIDAELRVAKRRRLRMLFYAYGLECLSIQLGNMDMEQLDAMAKLMGSHETICAM